MDILAKLFGGIAYVKIMRLFLFNPEMPFEVKDIRLRAQVTPETAKRETAHMHTLGLIKRKNFFKEVAQKSKKTSRIVKRKVRGWVLNKEFPFIEQLRNILLNSEAFYRGNIVDRFRHTGTLKLVIISGVFMNEWQRTDARGRVDVLIVGERLNQRTIRTAIKILESEIGRELHYAAIKTDDFLYRRSMYDKFIRDILDYPHEVLIDKLGV